MGKRGPKPLPRAERFWSRVERTESCWLWTGTALRRRGGYGTFYDDPNGDRPRLRRANRVAYELAHGVELNDPNVKVRHTCDTPRCVRPEHLVLGTQADNLRDMRERNRWTPPPGERGEKRYNAKLTDEIVRQARIDHANGVSIGALARRAKVSRACMAYAIHGKSWAHVR